MYKNLNKTHYQFHFLLNRHVRLSGKVLNYVAVGVERQDKAWHELQRESKAQKSCNISMVQSNPDISKTEESLWGKEKVVQD